MLILLVLSLIKKNLIVFYSIGINHYEINNNHNTIHAEVDSILNLKINTKKKSKQVNMFVFRTNPKGTILLHSKPCNCCLKYIKNNLYKKNYKLNNLYYINNNNILDII